MEGESHHDSTSAEKEHEEWQPGGLATSVRSSSSMGGGDHARSTSNSMLGNSAETDDGDGPFPDTATPIQAQAAPLVDRSNLGEPDTIGSEDASRSPDGLTGESNVAVSPVLGRPSEDGVGRPPQEGPPQATAERSSQQSQLPSQNIAGGILDQGGSPISEEGGPCNDQTAQVDDLSGSPSHPQHRPHSSRISAENDNDSPTDEEEVRDTMEELMSHLAVPPPPLPSRMVACQVEDTSLDGKTLDEARNSSFYNSTSVSIGSTGSAAASAPSEDQRAVTAQETGSRAGQSLGEAQHSLFSHHPSVPTRSAGSNAASAPTHDRRVVTFRDTSLQAEAQRTEDSLVPSRDQRAVPARGEAAWRRMTVFIGRSAMVNATLVDEERSENGNEEMGEVVVASRVEVVVASRVSFWALKWKRFGFALLFLLLCMTVMFSLFMTKVIKLPKSSGDDFQPTSSPTFDPTPTLDIVRRRGKVRCGITGWALDDASLGLCRSIAAVLFGNPDKLERVGHTAANRWKKLHYREVDLLVGFHTHTVEREVHEPSTGVGFTFSTPFYYDGMVYYEDETFVRCAEKQKRYDECKSIKICVVKSTTHYGFLLTAFPSRYLQFGSTFSEVRKMLQNGMCNVAASDKLRVIEIMSEGKVDERFIYGDEMMTNEPLAIVTRNDDREFSDIVNWVLQALLYGEEHGLTKNPQLCPNSTPPDSHELDFLDAVHCVGNYGEIHEGTMKTQGMNQINNGNGMIYAIPFGRLDEVEVDPHPESMLKRVMDKGRLECGVVIPDSYEGNVSESDGLVGMGVDYCCTLAATLFSGNSNSTNFTTYPETSESPFIALASGSIDVLIGGRAQKKHDFQISPQLGGLTFSAPYYYGNEPAGDDMSFYSIATRDDDAQFSSFVNCIVLATIYAQEHGVTKENSRNMPLVHLFGTYLDWALRDAIFYSGSYDQIHTKNFGANMSQISRGRNTLNNGGPMMHSIPGLSEKSTYSYP